MIGADRRYTLLDHQQKQTNKVFITERAGARLPVFAPDPEVQIHKRQCSEGQLTLGAIPGGILYFRNPNLLKGPQANLLIFSLAEDIIIIIHNRKR